MITLLAMSPSGEMFFTRDSKGILREHRRLGRRDPLEVSEAIVDRVVDRYGYTVVDANLSDWGAVEQFVEANVPKRTINPDELPLNPDLARRAVSVLERWLTKFEDVHLVVPTVNRFLANADVASDTELRTALLSLSTRAASIASHENRVVRLPTDLPAPPNNLSVRYRETGRETDATAAAAEAEAAMPADLADDVSGAAFQ